MEFNINSPSAVTDSDLSRPGVPARHRTDESDDVRLATYPSRIDLSAREQGLSYLIRLIQSTPDIREEKVAKIQRALKNSIYAVNARQIADKIIDGNPFDKV